MNIGISMMLITLDDSTSLEIVIDNAFMQQAYAL
jgi:hypothetical protein